MDGLDRQMRLDKLEAMVGKKYIYQGHDVVRIEEITATKDIITIQTDVWSDSFDLTGFDEWIEYFKPSFTKKDGITRPENIANLVLRGSSTLEKLVDKTFDIISQVEKNKDFVEQAKTINDLLKTAAKAEEVRVNAIIEVFKK